MVVGALKPRKIFREYNIKIHSRKTTNKLLLYLPYFQKPRVCFVVFCFFVFVFS